MMAAGGIDESKDAGRRLADQNGSAGLLSGTRVLELGHFVAAPFCTRVLADFGADVIKVEPPGRGDPVRQWGAFKDGHALWWSVHGRNKRCISLNLKHAAARDVVLDLVKHCDALVENFRPGQLARLGLSDEALRVANPTLIIAHISGYGQDGPGRDRAAFGVIGESVGGLRFLTNHAPSAGTGLPPVRVGVSIGDSLAGLYAAFGIAAALFKRTREDATPAATIDVALSDAVLSMLEGALTEYGALGIVRQPHGGGLPTAAPTNAYPTADGGWHIIAANSDALFRRLAGAMDAPELLADARFSGNQGRVEHVAALDALITQWTSRHDAGALEEKLATADVPNTRVFTIADCAADTQFRHRGMVREVEDPHFGPVLHPGVVPQVAGQADAVRWTGPDVGDHNRDVFEGLLGFSPDRVAALHAEGVC